MSMKRRIELYGRLRDAGLGPVLVLDLPAHTSAREALSVLKSSFGAPLTGCVLASADAVLSPNEKLPAGRLALLPPVCGG
jgi:hypothetical protein